MDLSFTCNCGKFAMQLPGYAAHNGAHILCHCKDCRAFARHFGKADRLVGGALRVFMARPDRLKILRGADNLGAIKLSSKGLTRWHTTCCGAPISSHKPGFPAFVGLTAMNAVDPASIGDPIAHYFTRQAQPGAGAPSKDTGAARLITRILGWSLAAFFARNAQFNPFPAAIVPRILSEEERRAAYSEGSAS